jgi:putative ABC transport system permease protein
MSDRAFRALLALYPTEFRNEYGHEMALLFADRYRDADGSYERARLWVEAIAGVLRAAPAEHLRAAVQDVRDAARGLRSSPAFAVTSIAILALAIGTSIAMFSVVNAVLLRALPYDSPDRLTMVFTEIPAQGVREGRLGFATVDEWRRQSRTFSDLAVFDPISVTFTRGGDLEQISVLRVSPNVFPLLGLDPVRGRPFSPLEAERRQRLALISHRFWQSHFGGSEDAIGASLQFDGATSEIVGILPESIQRAGFSADVWEPHTLFPDWETRRGVSGPGSWFVVGRLRPGITLEEAQGELRTLPGPFSDRQPAGNDRRISVTPFDLYVTGARPRLALWALTGAAWLLLMTAAANVAGLSLARSVGRMPEMAIRTALGASRARIVRLLLAESLTIAAAAGTLGLLLAAAGIEMIRSLGPANLVRLQEASIDLRVLAWASAVSVFTAVVVALAPGAVLARADLRAVGSEGGRSIVGGSFTRLRRLLVVGECAAAMMLLAGAGLLVRSWANVMRVDPGFRSERVLSLAVAPPAAMKDAQRAAFYDGLLERVSALPGVERAGISSELFVGNVAAQLVTAEASDVAVPRPVPLRRDEVSPAFFETLGTPLVRGRAFSSADGPGAAPVVIVNETMANRLWPGGDPLGRRIRFGPPRPGATWFTVVGVVGDMRRQGLEAEPVSQVFEALAQNPSGRVILFARTSQADPLELAGPLRAAVRELDPRALVYSVATVDERLGALVSQRRSQTWLLSALSAAALLLATIGLFGLMQHSVATRTQEIGVRMALGARGGDIFRMVVREGLLLSLAGLGIGLVGASWLGRAVSSLLFGVTAMDPATLAAASALLVAVATLACVVPARRAMRVAPIVALRR